MNVQPGQRLTSFQSTRVAPPSGRALPSVVARTDRAQRNIPQNQRAASNIKLAGPARQAVATPKSRSPLATPQSNLQVRGQPARQFAVTQTPMNVDQRNNPTLIGQHARPFVATPRNPAIPARQHGLQNRVTSVYPVSTPNYAARQNVPVRSARQIPGTSNIVITQGNRGKHRRSRKHHGYARQSVQHHQTTNYRIVTQQKSGFCARFLRILRCIFCCS